jgi:hypothetical protein
MKLLLASAALFLAAPAGLAAAEAPAAEAPAAEAAPTADHLALARQYVALVRPGGNDVEDMRSGMLTGAIATLGEGASDQKVAEVKQQVEAVAARFEPILLKRVPRINEAYALAYAREFSAAELRDLVAFAATPLGRKFHASYLSVQYDDAVMEAEEALAEEIEPLVNEIRKAACAEAAAKRVAMGDAKATCPLADKTATG